MTDHEIYTITQSPEYAPYMKALSRLASAYIPRIRRQFAEQALEKFQNETVRRLVLAYGEEVEKLDADLLSDFKWAARYAGTENAEPYTLETSCLNHAAHYGETLKFLFDIK